MAQHNILVPYVVLNGTSMASTITSNPTNIIGLESVGYSVAWTGTPTGTFSVQISNDYAQTSTGSVYNAGTWTTLTLSGTPAASGSASNGYLDVYGCSAAWMRLVYTASSGSGNLTAVVAGKAF